MSYSFMRYYVQHLDGNSCSMQTFYEHFPAWDDIQEKIKDFTEDWTEDNHNDFEAFAEWCADREHYQANWLPTQVAQFGVSVPFSAWSLRLLTSL